LITEESGYELQIRVYKGESNFFSQGFRSLLLYTSCHERGQDVLFESLEIASEPMWTHVVLPAMIIYIYISWKSCYQRLKSFSKHTFKEAWEIEKNNTNMYTKEKKLNKIKEECLFVEAL
jgi:hypothetical protein